MQRTHARTCAAIAMASPVHMRLRPASSWASPNMATGRGPRPGSQASRVITAAASASASAASSLHAAHEQQQCQRQQPFSS